MPEDRSLSATCGSRDLLRRDVRNSSIFNELAGSGYDLVIWFRVLDSDSSFTGQFEYLFRARHILALIAQAGSSAPFSFKVKDFFVTLTASAMAAVSSMRLNNAKPPKFGSTPNVQKEETGL